MKEIFAELKIVKEEARKSYEKARDANQMEAAAMFLAQVERMLTSKLGLDTLMAELNKTDPMPEYGNDVPDMSGAQGVPPVVPGEVKDGVPVQDPNTVDNAIIKHPKTGGVILPDIEVD